MRTEGMLFSLLLVISRVSSEVLVDSNSDLNVQKVSLGANMILYWTVKGTKITFGLHARTNGYVGFGISPLGTMAAADIVLGWVVDGNATLLDLHATKNGKPVKDEQQDWELLYAEETSGKMMLRFSRLLDTGDCWQDVRITGNTMQVIWAFSEEDPKSEDDLKYHGLWNRGALKLHLLDNSKPPVIVAASTDTYVHQFIMPRVSVPKTRSSVHLCQVFPVDMVDRQHHGIKFSRVIDNAAIVYRIVAYACYNAIADASLHNAGFECYSPAMPSEFRACREPIFGWSVGGEDELILPNDAGVSIGAPNDAAFILLEIHYENSMMTDWVDQSGFRIWFTNTLRLHDVGSLVIGSTLASSQIIPPGGAFTTYGLCYSDCLDQATTNQRNISVFSYSLHTHALGRSIRVRLIRDEEQIDWLGRDESYDSNFQETRFFATPKTLMKGDYLVVECVYDSSARKYTTFGGLNASDEQCLVFLQYYPKVDLAWCTSTVPYTVQSTVINGVKVQENGIVTKPTKYAGLFFTTVLNSSDWDSGPTRQLQKMQTGEHHVLQCETATGGVVSQNLKTYAYPSFDKFVETNKCVASKLSKAWVNLSLLTTALLAVRLLGYSM